MQLGEFEITRVSGGRFRLDGGAMFGVVPKLLWNRASPADEQNRIQLDTNCVLVQSNAHRVLIDTGFGTKLDERQREIHAIDNGDPLMAGLIECGMEAADITHVIPSHLHFDHAGGLTRSDGSGGFVPTFPNARVCVQAEEWEDAIGDRPELAGNYFRDELLPIERAGLLDIVASEQEIVPGIRVEKTGAHTRGHQVIHLESEHKHAVYLGDLCPTQAHLKTMWTMAYDQFPLEVRLLKPRFLDRACEEGHWVLLDHDPHQPWGLIERDEKHQFRFTPIVQEPT